MRLPCSIVWKCLFKGFEPTFKGSERTFKGFEQRFYKAKKTFI